MAYTLEEFAADCHRILKADPGAAGREQVRRGLEKLLLEDSFGVIRECIYARK